MHVATPARLALFAAVLAPAAAAQALPRTKEWSQPHGDATGTAAVDVAPLSAPPEERWRRAGVLLDPVVTHGRLFVLELRGGGAALVALDPATGAPAGEVVLDGIGEPLALVAADGVVALIEAKSARAWRRTGERLEPAGAIAGTFGGEPTSAGGLFLVPREDGTGLQSLDWGAGKATLALASGFGRAAALLDDAVGGKAARSLYALRFDDKKDDAIALDRVALPAAPGQKAGPAQAAGSGPRVATADGAARAVLTALLDGTALEWYAWYGGADAGGLFHDGGFARQSFQQPPASHGGRLYGFDKLDRLVEFDAASRGMVVLVAKEQMLPGARLGAPSIARDVLFLGNWAVDLNHHRVLWCLRDVDPAGPAIPTGERLLAVRTRGGELIGFGAGASAAPVAEEVPDTLVLPGREPGIVRVDGRFLPGKVSALQDGGFRLVLEGGRTLELAADDVAMADPGDAPKRLGEEHPIYRACWRVLAARHVDRLIECFERWHELGRYDDCKRLLAEARGLGLAQARFDELHATLSGKPAGKGGPAERKAAAEAEAEARVDACDEVIYRAKWCARIGAPTAATVLLRRARELAPDAAIEDEADLIEQWTPDSFDPEVLAEAKAKVRDWPSWADALLPSGAVFAKLDDSQERRLSVTKFATGAISLRTRNVLLHTKEMEPKLLGPLLVRGEATIRALQKILGESPDKLSPNVPLEVRLYVERKDYLADNTTPPEWSAGCYSPADGISRFYSRQSGDERDPLAHSLQEVFAHELTHHYVDRRWVRGRGAGATGSYWMVEGFAEFTAGQALEIGRLGDAFDDPTAEAIDRAAAAHRANQLLPLEFLLQIDRKLFASELEGGQFGPVRLRHTLDEVYLDKRGVFYAEATALTFFVMNRCGPDGRATYRRWLQQVYEGKPLESPWKDLGFETVYEMRNAFREFLDSI